MLVEFALLLPAIVLLLIGLFELGRVFSTWLIVSHAAREGARHAVVGSSEGEVIQRVEEACPMLDPNSLVGEATGIQGPRGAPVIVRVTYPVEISPLLRPLFPQHPLEVTGQVLMALE